jgi:DNA sulfur modification protein DndD
MIFGTLTLHNFGLFRGEQALNLGPRQALTPCPSPALLSTAGGRGERKNSSRPLGEGQGVRAGPATPIILFGGMNGGGKTTLLDAVKLALYGSRGNYSKKGNIGYEEFLRDSSRFGFPRKARSS